VLSVEREREAATVARLQFGPAHAGKRGGKGRKEGEQADVEKWASRLRMRKRGEG
jgi:hypothetical protein